MSLATVTTRGFAPPVGDLSQAVLMGYGATAASSPPSPPPTQPASFGGPPWTYRWLEEACEDCDEEDIEEAEELIEEAVEILAAKPKNPVKAIANQKRDFSRLLAEVTASTKKEIINIWKEEVNARIREREQEEEEIMQFLTTTDMWWQ